SITREQMAAILYRYAQFKGFDVTGRADLTAFADAASISAYAEESISWANAEGLISGRSAAELAPQGTATHAEAASILVRFQKNVK
ncbi:MAG: S-layer homology domain-containing protein, partial [Butyricicoccus sp.]|nr:S-layer homology domain-containing protein [Butyricicoccus sp.]